MNTPALLLLEDGSAFHGTSIGYDGQSISSSQSDIFTVGEVVFNTAMTGYQEILTDPSYSKQIVTLTYPHVGNIGVNAKDAESDYVHAAGLIIRDLPLVSSSWRSEGSLGDYLNVNKVVAIADIDTRRLTRILREKGAQNGCIYVGEAQIEQAKQKIAQFPGLKGMDLAKEVTTQKNYSWTAGTWDLNTNGFRAVEERLYKVIAYDFGVKHNILRMLADRGCDITVVPAQTPASDVLAMSPDGVFLSNGPGDPEPCDYAIAAIKELLDNNMPLFGICLGHQLLALASGAKTEKMKFGHHGANHPVQNLKTKQVFISSQNHGFAASDEGLPDCLDVTHRSLFDGTLQGIARNDKPAFSFQGHPEASPGPHDLDHLFDQFIELIREHK